MKKPTSYRFEIDTLKLIDKYGKSNKSKFVETCVKSYVDKLEDHKILQTEIDNDKKHITIYINL